MTVELVFLIFSTCALAVNTWILWSLHLGPMLQDRRKRTEKR